ncbi:hypothetical protein SKAU_G00304450 [Synaphobranchus kaupii]|uniref:Uncharacterized protein n=1 Tax=Synaphobranchus kaupii TaxID=118154 RepID=A0A9Q1EW92_SYNKA|nr:hypothetical protein SKAU_G00304450 [Synaphobranchus kaupii]
MPVVVCEELPPGPRGSRRSPSGQPRCRASPRLTAFVEGDRQPEFRAAAGRGAPRAGTVQSFRFRRDSCQAPRPAIAFSQPGRDNLNQPEGLDKQRR